MRKIHPSRKVLFHYSQRSSGNNKLGRPATKCDILYPSCSVHSLNSARALVRRAHFIGRDGVSHFGKQRLLIGFRVFTPFYRALTLPFLLSFPRLLAVRSAKTQISYWQPDPDSHRCHLMEKKKLEECRRKAGMLTWLVSKYSVKVTSRGVSCAQRKNYRARHLPLNSNCARYRSSVWRRQSHFSHVRF